MTTDLTVVPSLRTRLPATRDSLTEVDPWLAPARTAKVHADDRGPAGDVPPKVAGATLNSSGGVAVAVVTSELPRLRTITTMTAMTATNATMTSQYRPRIAARPGPFGISPLSPHEQVGTRALERGLWRRGEAGWVGVGKSS